MACPKCFSGNIHSGTPTGKEVTVHGLSTYIAEPPEGTSPKGIIVIVTDAFGWEFINNRIVADKMAKKCSARVYMPDFMAGNAASSTVMGYMDTIMGNGWLLGKVMAGAFALTHFLPFMYRNRLSVATPRVLEFFKALRANEAVNLPVGTAGYCWGGKYTFMLCSDSEKASNGKSLVDCGFTAHPSNLVIPADAEAIKLPISISVGDIDFVYKIDQIKQTQEIFAKKEDVETEVVVIPKAPHGFAIRCAPNDEKGVEQAEQAFEQAVAWFDKYFAKTGY